MNETHLLADINKIVGGMREKRVCGERLCEVHTYAKWYAKKLRETPADGGSTKILTENEFLAVPFDKVNGFCVMKKTTYQG